ncbi:MAG: hypothetical protein M1827_007152 [Pycnora praestabilis]|nr:MAG: hypothetical protein M1827_007152 [Pycnora praestabilis]
MSVNLEAADQGVVLDGDNPAGNYVLQPRPKRIVKKQAPQQTIDEFWEKFTTKHPGKAFTILPNNPYAKRAVENAPKGVISGHNAVASFEEAARLCTEKVNQIVKECRRVNQKYRDMHFDIEFDLKWYRRDCLDGLTVDDSDLRPESVKRVSDIFDDPVFFEDGASAADVRQGCDGDCWFLAAICGISNKEGLISKICVARDEKVGVYGFVFHRDGEWISTIVDDKLYLTKGDYDNNTLERAVWDGNFRVDAEEEYRKTYQSGSRALYFAQCASKNETWLPLLEKAYAKAHGDFEAINGGFTGEAIEDLTGGVTTELFTSDILDKEQFWNEELMNVNKKFLFGCAAGTFRNWGTVGDRKGVVEGHAYSIMEARELKGERLVRLRNPWGLYEWNGAWSDGSKEWTPEWMNLLDHRFGDDGASSPYFLMFWMSYKDLLKKYDQFDRTRLFGPEWTVTQQWTSVDVPWTVDYHDTKFTITLTKDSPVVIVLSQIDDRYFKGLEGQYEFELQFRLHKDNEEEYIVRSHGNYKMRRSVSAELDLEAGHYSVLMKVIAVRDIDAQVVEEVVKQSCRDKRDKLLQIGLSYDLAHAKGQIKETDAEKKYREEREAKRKAADKQKRVKTSKASKEKAQQQQKKDRAKRAQRKERRAKKAASKKAEKASNDTNKEAKVKDEANEGLKENVPTSTDPKTAVPEKEAVVTDEKPIRDEKEDVSKSLPSPPPASTEPEESKGAEAALSLDPTTDAKPSEEEASALAPAAKVQPLEEKADPPTAGETPNININITTDAQAIPDLGNDSDNDTVSDFDPDYDVPDDTDEDNNDDKRSTISGPPPLPPMGEEDEFENDPWNAVCIVGLRVFSMDKETKVECVRPRDKDDIEGEDQLDVDDSAADAAKEGKSEEGWEDVKRGGEEGGKDGGEVQGEKVKE